MTSENTELEPGALTLTVIRAVLRQPPSARGARWDNVTVGWLPDPGRLFCDAHPTARRCEHIDHIREAIQ